MSKNTDLIKDQVVDLERSVAKMRGCLEHGDFAKAVIHAQRASVDSTGVLVRLVHELELGSDSS